MRLRTGGALLAAALAAMLALAVAAWFAVPRPAWADEPEGTPYAVLDGTGTLTFIRSFDEVDVGPYTTVAGTVTSVDGEAYTGDIFQVDEEGGSRPWAKISSMSGKVKAVVFKDRIWPKSVSGWFYRMQSLQTCDLAGLDLSRCTNMSKMFYWCTALSSADLSGLDTSAVRDMSYLFYRCSTLQSASLSGLDVSNVWNMSRMFEYCSVLPSLDLSGLDTSHVTDMSYLFHICPKLVSIDMSSFDTSSLRSCADMFTGCTRLASLRLSPSFSFTLAGASSPAISLPGRTRGVYGRWVRADGAYGPYEAEELAEAYDGEAMAGLWLRERAYAVIDSAGAMTFFRAASDLPSGNEGALAGRDGVLYEGTLYTGFEQDLYGSAGDASSPPWAGRARRVTSVRFADEVKPAGTALWFSGMSSCASIDLAGLDTARATDMSRMFYGCSSIASLDVSGLKVGAAKSLERMFFGCSSLARLDTSAMRPNMARSVEGMFCGCSSLVSVELPLFTASKLNYANFMFSGCTSLVSVDLSGIVAELGFFQRDMFRDNPCLASVKLGEGFSFLISSSIRPGAGNSCRLPEPPSGKWVRDDGMFGPYTPSELQKAYAPEMAGTWVWATPSYTVAFDAQGGQGSMARLVADPAEPAVLPPCTLYRLGASFQGWALEPGGPVAYPDGGALPAGAFAAWQEAALYAVWGEGAREAEVSEGRLRIELRAGEEALVALPAGTSYQVWEELPAGWALAARSGTSGTVLPGAQAEARFTNRCEPGTASVCLAGSKTLDGAPPKAGSCWFQLVDAQGRVVQAVTNGEGGGFAFSPLSFSEPQEVRYVVREAPGDDPSVEYDPSEFGVTVVVEADGEGALSARAVWDRGAPAFENRTRPGSLVVSKSVVGSPAADAEFTLQVDLGGGDVRSLALRAGESAAIEGIAAGTRYRVSEPALPLGYSLVSSAGAEGVIQAGAASAASFTNSYAASGAARLAAAKTMDGGPPGSLSFEFGLYDGEGSRVASAWNASNGEVVFPEVELSAPGTYTYTMREEPLQGAGGVVGDLSEHTAVVEAADMGDGRLACSVSYFGPAGEPEEVPVFRNVSAPGGVLLVKTDAETGAPVPGAVYELRGAGGEAVARAVTSEEGEALFEGVAPGAYALVETEAPRGYAVSAEALEVTVEAGERARADCRDRRARGGLAVRKTDQGGNPLAGAEFEVRDADGAVWARVTSGADGVAATPADALPCGSYTVSESVAPRGYSLNEAWSAEFSIEEDGAVADLTGSPCADAAAWGQVLPRSGGSARPLRAGALAGALVLAGGLAAALRLRSRRPDGAAR